MADGFSGNSLHVAQALVTLAGAITHNQSGQGIRNAGETPGASTSIFPTSDAASATTGTPRTQSQDENTSSSSSSRRYC